jgi:biotin carboxylase
MPRGVLMLGGSSCEELVAAVERRGLVPVALTVPEVAQRVAPAAGLAHLEVMDLSASLQVLRRVRELDADFRFAGVVSVLEQTLEMGLLLARQLRLPVPGGVSACRNKIRMRKALDAAGVPHLRWRACRSATEAAAFLVELGGPAVVKPAAGTGSEGVCRVDRPQEAAAAFERAASVSHGGGVLCEEYVEGPEVSVEGWMADGRFHLAAVTDKETGEAFVEVGHRQPTVQPPAVVKALYAAVADAHAALGVDRAVTHGELRLTERGPVLMETHTRMGGGFIHLLTQQAAGVDLADHMVGLALGETPTSSAAPTGRGCAAAFLARGTGRLAAVELPPPVPGLLRGEMWVRPGHLVGPCRASRDRLGAAVATGADGAAAARTAAEWLDAVRLEWAPESAAAVAV